MLLTDLPLQMLHVCEWPIFVGELCTQFPRTILLFCGVSKSVADLYRLCVLENFEYL